MRHVFLPELCGNDSLPENVAWVARQTLAAVTNQACARDSRRQLPDTFPNLWGHRDERVERLKGLEPSTSTLASSLGNTGKPLIQDHLSAIRRHCKRAQGPVSGGRQTRYALETRYCTGRDERRLRAGPRGV